MPLACSACYIYIHIVRFYIIILQLFIPRVCQGVGIKHMYSITDPLFILASVIISKIENKNIIYYHDITLITKFQINILNIEYVITNSH